MITKEDVVKDFTAGIDCSQVVLRECAEKIGLSAEQACKIASPFGGGMFRGDTCGAVSGALLVLGLQYGHCRAGDLGAKGCLAQKAAASGQLFERCPVFVLDALEILNNV